MKAKKYISAADAKKSSRGGAAVFAALIYTVLTAAVCLRSFSEGLPAHWTGYILPGILALNALSLWTVIFSGKKFGLRVVRIVQIIALIASVAVTAAVAEIFISSLTNTDSLVGKYIDISILSTFNMAGMICLLVGCAVAVLFCISALGYVSAASRAQDGKHAIASGRLLSVMSFILGIVLTAFIPVYLFAGTLGKAIGLDISLLNLKNVSFDFAAYTVQDYAVLVVLAAAPVFYFLLSAAAGKMARSKTAQEAPAVATSVEAEPASVETPAEVSFIYTDEPAVETAVETAPERVTEPEPCVEEVTEEVINEVIDTPSEAYEETSEDMTDEAAVAVAAAIPAAAVVSEVVSDEPTTEPAVAPVVEPVVAPVVEPVVVPVVEPVVSATAAPTAAAYIPGTNLIDFGYCEVDII